MAHYKTFFDHDLIGAWDLQGRDVTVTIEAVQAGKVGHGAKAAKKPVLTFKGRTGEKRMACNVTNAKTIAGMYGPETQKWIGQKITLYPTTTQFGNETHECIRVRPTKPTGRAEPIADVERPTDRHEPNPLNEGDEP